MKFIQKNALTVKVKRNLLFVCSCLVLTFNPNTTCAQSDLNSNTKTPRVSIINEDTSLSLSIIDGFENIIYKVYPKLVKDFNKNARMDISVKIDTAYDGVAYANNGRVTVSSKWLHKKPKDLDLMTHEIMHIIQSYPNGAGPGWLTEGIADFVRYKYGVDNESAKWSLTEFSKNQSYKNSYRITARFLVWISQNYDKKIVVKMDNKLRSNKYSPKLWEKYTGLSIDQLWDNYSKNPSLK
ncbi:secretory protein [Aureibaculum algae]|uniref:Secretory protein n=2 Tax=Aureibaculum algae TaxID=2584122 RepID=A0A5B7TLW9_9FLAO|nr:secretory protein [Aureibaculum algae]